MRVALIGPGKIGIEYFKVLKALDVKDLTVVGRGAASSRFFFEATGQQPILDDDRLSKLMETRPEAAIVAVSVENLCVSVSQLLRQGVTRILLEKPAGVDIQEITQVTNLAKEFGAEIFVAYNRRHYSSIIELRRLIEEDGGVLSFHFDFTEWPHMILPEFTNPRVLDNWLLANSSHVIDLAFHLCGKPKSWECRTSGSLPWHKRGSVFAGSGVTHAGSLFSYHSNWESPGRWGIEICTARRKYFLRPLEKLQAQKHGSVAIEPVELDDRLDLSFKPGLFKQTESFLSRTNTESMIRIEEHLRRVTEVYFRIIEGTHSNP